MADLQMSVQTPKEIESNQAILIGGTVAKTKNALALLRSEKTLYNQARFAYLCKVKALCSGRRDLMQSFIAEAKLNGLTVQVSDFKIIDSSVKEGDALYNIWMKYRGQFIKLDVEVAKFLGDYNNSVVAIKKINADESVVYLDYQAFQNVTPGAPEIKQVRREVSELASIPVETRLDIKIIEDAKSLSDLSPTAQSIIERETAKLSLEQAQSADPVAANAVMNQAITAESAQLQNEAAPVVEAQGGIGKLFAIAAAAGLYFLGS